MRTARFASFVVLTALVACGELRNAEVAAPPVDGGGTASADAASAREDDATTGTNADEASRPDAEAGVPLPAPDCDGGCPVETLSTPAMQDLTALAVDGERVYFAGLAAQITSCAKTGCTGTATKFPGFAHPQDLVVANGALYWADGQEIHSCATAGCTTVTTFYSEPKNVSFLRGNGGVSLVWAIDTLPRSTVNTCTTAHCIVSTLTIGDPTALVVRGTQLAWTETIDGVQTCSFGATEGQCEATKKTLSAAGIASIAIQDGTVFWVIQNQIKSCAFGGCPAPKLIAKTTSPTHLVTDATHVYWRDAVEDALYRCPLGGCTAPELVARLGDANPDAQIALDGDHVYWTEKAGLFRRRK